ncbi:hypothetical protein BS50DRAFT_627550 [Corynespora cassiicola Philippines]|uniref:HIG1 domain-containing protein n=1 Tax=Corynespora cassiicola Philippines TaxID=1448308 RepID=A0A2T2P970_CORCC|nr:hypothetical protein BS50DRAFT_627550 [Corynespora cassiicola Philippines]
MPAQPKSFWPALASFIAFSFTYTAVVARGEGNAIDNARTRWQNQMQRGNQAMSDHGASLLAQQGSQK